MVAVVVVDGGGGVLLGEVPRTDLRDTFAAQPRGLSRVLRRLRSLFQPRAQQNPPDRDSDQQAVVEVLPYSPCNEVKFFFQKGIPLGLASVLSWGLPPLLSMVFAGHTQHSAHLQTSLGYGRVWYMCTVLMTTLGMCSYFQNVIPGCIGARREDRIPTYFRRSMIFSVLLMFPIYCLQFAAGSIMQSFGVPEENIPDIRIYCRIMVLTGLFTLLASHLETTLINLGYVKAFALNSFVCGLGVDISCTYLFVLQWQWGAPGAALAQMTVQASRALVWTVLVCYYNLPGTFLATPREGERLFDKAEMCEFIRLGIPTLLGFYASWLIFEFQLMLLTRVHGIEVDALAAGAAWVQIESALGSAQTGWLQSTNMRCLNLLGKQDPGARTSFAIFNALAVVIVGVSTVPFALCQGSIASFLTNDAVVQQWLRKITWVLVPHSLTRCVWINTQSMFVPLGKGMLGSLVSFVSYYCFALPLCGLFALSDVWTHEVALKMVACVGMSAVAQTFGMVFSSLWLWRLDWQQAGQTISHRANMDKTHQNNNNASMESLHPALEADESLPAGFGLTSHLGTAAIGQDLVREV